MKKLRYMVVFYGMVGIILVVIGTWLWNKFRPEPSLWISGSGDITLSDIEPKGPLPDTTKPWAFSPDIIEFIDSCRTQALYQMFFDYIYVDTLYARRIILNTPGEVGVIVDSANQDYYWIDGKRYEW